MTRTHHARTHIRECKLNLIGEFFFSSLFLPLPCHLLLDIILIVEKLTPRQHDPIRSEKNDDDGSLFSAFLPSDLGYSSCCGLVDSFHR